MNWTAQIIGAAGSLCAIVSAQFKRRKHLMLMQLLSCVFLILHYTMLGALTGAVSGGISLLRVLLFSANRSWAKKPVCLWSVLLLCTLNVAITWHGVASLLAGIASCCTTLALWNKDMQRTRLWFLADAPCWLVYNILVHSLSGIIAEVIAMISYSIAIVRLDLAKRNNVD